MTVLAAMVQASGLVWWKGKWCVNPSICILNEELESLGYDLEELKAAGGLFHYIFKDLYSEYVD